MRTAKIAAACLVLAGATLLTACGGSDAEFCSTLEDVRTALSNDDATLRGERTSAAEAPNGAYKATKTLHSAAKCEVIDGGSGLVTYACEYPTYDVEKLRDRVNTCGGEPLKWDESGKQWFRGAGDNLTLSVAAMEGGGASLFVTHY